MALEIWDLLTIPSATTPKPSSTIGSGWRSPEKLKTAKARGKLWEIWEVLTLASATTPKRSSTLSSSWRSPEKLKTAKARGGGAGNLGNAYRNLGDGAKAIDYAQQKLAIAREIKDREGEGNALGNLGLVYGSLGDYAKAIEYKHQQSLAIELKVSKTEKVRAHLWVI